MALHHVQLTLFPDLDQHIQDPVYEGYTERAAVSFGINVEGCFKKLMIVFIRHHPQRQIGCKARTPPLDLRNLDGYPVLLGSFAGDRKPEQIGATALVNKCGHDRCRAAFAGVL